MCPALCCTHHIVETDKSEEEKEGEAGRQAWMAANLHTHVKPCKHYITEHRSVEGSIIQGWLCCGGGAGRIPSGLNGCVGLKGTVGRVSTTGVVPASASLDCLTCFAATVRDAAKVVQIMQVTKVTGLQGQVML